MYVLQLCLQKYGSVCSLNDCRALRNQLIAIMETIISNRRVRNRLSIVNYELDRLFNTFAQQKYIGEREVFFHAKHNWTIAQ